MTTTTNESPGVLALRRAHAQAIAMRLRRACGIARTVVGTWTVSDDDHHVALEWVQAPFTLTAGAQPNPWLNYGGRRISLLAGMPPPDSYTSGQGTVADRWAWTWRISLDQHGAIPHHAAIRATREDAWLTQQEAAHIVYSSARTWQTWEAGSAEMHPGLWELFISRVALLKQEARPCPPYGS